LFGSRARGDHRENSDVDLAVEWASGRRKEVLTLISNLNEKAITLYKIDLLDVADITNKFKDEIDNEGILLWQKKD
jgi:uncharacterized protein